MYIFLYVIVSIKIESITSQFCKIHIMSCITYKLHSFYLIFPYLIFFSIYNAETCVSPWTCTYSYISLFRPTNRPTDWLNERNKPPPTHFHTISTGRTLSIVSQPVSHWVSMYRSREKFYIHINKRSNKNI